MTYSGNRYLSQAEMAENAQYILDYMSGKGWTKEAVCGMLGNMESESTINPGVWESLSVGSGGYGLVQWTPASKWISWASANGYAQDSIDGQLERICWEAANGEQWITTSAHPMSFQAFTQSTDSPYNLAMTFIANYERPKNPTQPIRGTQAENWYNSLADGSGAIVNKAIEWALAIAADNSHGYDQGSRDGPDYDCSSFVSWAYATAGLNTRPGYSPATGTMYSVFTAAGFTDVTGQVNLSTADGMKPGDVLLKPGHHTEMYIGNGQNVGAHQNEFGGITGGAKGDQTGKEICTNSYYNYPWDYVLRYKNGGGSGGGGGGGQTESLYIASWTPA